VLQNHQEFGGRVVQEDNPSGTHFHATHVAGTMVAAGVKPNAKGMSYEALLGACDWSYDNSEMANAAAAGMEISNHSYGYIVGWYKNGDWYWYGDTGVSGSEDYGFGFYGDDARAWDNIAYNAPYYTIVKSAGNDRSNTGPVPGGGHWVWNGGWVWSTDVREPDGGADGYDSVAWSSTAKNILTVGAVQDIPGGFADPTGVVMTSFSAWGPTDDGRIKPDIVANGAGLYSCTDANATAYGSYSGTSMAAPNMSGSLNLLVRHHEDTHGDATPLSATMKAIVVETADEAGPHPGPDYMCGWGLANTRAAAELIEADANGAGYVFEATLRNGATDDYVIVSNGLDPLRITIAWTDPPGTVPAPSLDPPDLMLVNDLDLRVEHVESGLVHEPYVLDRALPANAAGRGDNFRDNVEQIVVESPAAGEYRVTVTHKGALASDQDYSIVSLGPLAAAETGIDEGVGAGHGFVLYRNYPNPFNPRTTIRYELKENARVSLRIHDVTGRIVRVIESEVSKAPGVYEFTWDGTDRAGRTVASAVYFYRLDVGQSSETRRMVMLK